MMPIERDVSGMNWQKKLLVGVILLYDEGSGWDRSPEEKALRATYEDMLVNASDEECGRAAVEWMVATDPGFLNRMKATAS